MSVTPLPLCSLHFWLPIVGQFLSHCPAAGNRRKGKDKAGREKSNGKDTEIGFFFKFFQTHTTAATAAEYMTILNGRFLQLWTMATAEGIGIGMEWKRQIAIGTGL